jgi:hypothetical protein
MIVEFSPVSFSGMKELNVAVGLWFMVFNATFNNISVILRFPNTKPGDSLVFSLLLLSRTVLHKPQLI